MIDQETINLANSVEITKIPLYFGYEKPRKIICPLHEETHESCTYFEKKNTFHCFSCGKNFDSIGLFMELSENAGKPCTFQEAVRDVLEIGEMEFESQTVDTYTGKSSYKASDKYYGIILNNCKPMQGYEVNYLAERGIFIDGGYVYNGKPYSRKSVFWHIDNAKNQADKQFWQAVKEEGTFYKGISSNLLRQNYIEILHNYYKGVNHICYKIQYDEFICDDNAKRRRLDFDWYGREMIIQKSMDTAHTKRSIGETNYSLIVNGFSDQCQDIYVTEGIEDAFSILSMHVDSMAISLNSTSNLENLISDMKNRFVSSRLDWHICFDHDKTGRKKTEELIQFFDSQNEEIATRHPNLKKKIAKANGGRIDFAIGYYNYDVYDYPECYNDINDYWKSIVFGK